MPPPRPPQPPTGLADALAGTPNVRPPNAGTPPPVADTGPQDLNAGLPEPMGPMPNFSMPDRQYSLGEVLANLGAAYMHKQGTDKRMEADAANQARLADVLSGSIGQGGFDLQGAIASGIDPATALAFAEHFQNQGTATPGEITSVEDPYGRGGTSVRQDGEEIRYLPPETGTQSDTWSAPYIAPDGSERQRNEVTGVVKIITPAPDAPEVGGISMDDEQALRQEWTQLSKHYKDVQDGFQGVLAAAGRNTAAGDHSLIFNYMKTIDPDSVVRETEFEIAQSLGSMPQWVRAMAERYISGQRLTPEQRESLVDASRAAWAETHRNQVGLRTQWQEEILDPRGITSQGILLNFIEEPWAREQLTELETTNMRQLDPAEAWQIASTMPPEELDALPQAQQDILEEKIREWLAAGGQP